MAVALRFLVVGFALMLAACTPSHTVATGQAVAGKLRLQDGVEVERANQRLLSRQTQVCLVSDQRLESHAVLEAMQRGFGGYFLAVGIDSAPLDYASALQNPPCPGAQYVFYVELTELQCSGERAPDGQCAQQRLPKQLAITVINREDRSLADRIKMSLSRGLLSSGSEQDRLQRSFEQLAALLTGAGSDT